MGTNAAWMISREVVYRVLSTCTNSFGVIDKSQGDMAKLLGVSYQQLSKIYAEFTDMGMLEKNKHKFTVLYDPNDIPWGEKYDALRAKYIEENGAINATKSDRTRRKDVLDVR